MEIDVTVVDRAVDVRFDNKDHEPLSGPTPHGTAVLNMANKDIPQQE